MRRGAFINVTFEGASIFEAPGFFGRRVCRKPIIFHHEFNPQIMPFGILDCLKKRSRIRSHVTDETPYAISSRRESAGNRAYPRDNRARHEAVFWKMERHGFTRHDFIHDQLARYSL